MNQNDRRVRRTKKILKETLAELLLEKDLHEITVRELTDKADLSRGTFYAHYTDVFDLFEQMEKDAFDEMRNIMDLDPTHVYDTLFNSLLDYVKDNEKICKLFMSQGSKSNFRDKLSVFLEENVSKIVLYEMNATEMKDDWRFLTRYHSYALIAVLSLWLETGFTYPRKKLVNMIMSIDDCCDDLYEQTFE